jgi:Tfp pilus assembly protein PilF
MLGQTFLYLNQPSLAFHYLDKAVRMDPSNYITHNLLAQACKAIGQLEEATREFKTCAGLQHGGAPSAIKR